MNIKRKYLAMTINSYNAQIDSTKDPKRKAVLQHNYAKSIMKYQETYNLDWFSKDNEDYRNILCFKDKAFDLIFRGLYFIYDHWDIISKILLSIAAVAILYITMDIAADNYIEYLDAHSAYVRDYVHKAHPELI